MPYVSHGNPSRPADRTTARNSISARQLVLIVDDEPPIVELVRGYLDRDGFAVKVALDGPSALASASADPPDVVVLDVMLPGLDGLEVCRQLRTFSARVFERFYRIDPSRSRAPGGSGIGLAIARALAEAMGGSVRAESDGPGAGSTFLVALPEG